MYRPPETDYYRLVYHFDKFIDIHLLKQALDCFWGVVLMFVLMIYIIIDYYDYLLWPSSKDTLARETSFIITKKIKITCFQWFRKDNTCEIKYESFPFLAFREWYAKMSFIDGASGNFNLHDNLDFPSKRSPLNELNFVYQNVDNFCRR